VAAIGSVATVCYTLYQIKGPSRSSSSNLSSMREWVKTLDKDVQGLSTKVAVLQERYPELMGDLKELKNKLEKLNDALLKFLSSK